MTAGGRAGHLTMKCPSPPAVWDDVSGRAPGATFFHTRTWAEILARTYPQLRVKTPVFALDNGTTAVLPLMEKAEGLRGFFRSYESMTPGVYGGLLATGPVLAVHTKEIVAALVDWHVTALTVTGNPYAACPSFEGLSSVAMSTQSVDLARPIDDIWASLDDANRRAVRKATKSGLTVSLAASEDEYRDYFLCYEDSLARWGGEASSRYPLELFLNVMKMTTSDQSRLWVIRHEGRLISGSLVFYHRDHAVYWHGASHHEAMSLRPSNLIHWEAIRDAHARGFRWFDFNPSGGHEGVRRYKDTFKPTTLHFERSSLSTANETWQWYRKAQRAFRKVAGR